jgi:hypothetical protein
MTPQALEEDPTRSSRDIEQDIRARRGKMDETLDELGERLTLRSLVNTALEWWDEPPAGNRGSVAARKACKTLVRQVKHHPVPALLIGSGIAWLVADSAEDDDPPRQPAQPHPRDRGGEAGATPVADTLEQAKDSVAGAVDTVKEKASEYADSAGELSRRAIDRGKSTARRMGREVIHGYEAGADSFGRAVDHYPLGVGVAFAALGALVGLALPHTRKEDKMMGTKSDELLDAAKEKGTGMLDAGKAIGGRVIEAVKEEAGEQGLSAKALAGTLGEMAGKGGQVVEKAKSELQAALEPDDAAKA